MQHVYVLSGLCLLLGVCVTPGLADISLTLRNGRNGGPAYLPPPAQSLPIDDAINEAINEEIIKIQEESDTRNKFDESKYGNAKYHVFEVHNQYHPQQQQQQQKSGSYAQAQAQAQGNSQSYAQGQAQSSFKGPDYLPPNHGSSAQQVNDDHFDLSFVNNAFADSVPAQGPQQSSAPSSNPIPVPFPSNYQHDFEQNGPQQESVFQGPDYLPPNQEASLPEVDNYNDVSIGGQDQGVHGGSVGFKGPDYLPPTTYPQQSGSVANAQAGVNVGASASAGASGVSGGAGFSAGRNSGAFRGPDYLPPHGSQSSAGVDVSANAGGNSGAFRGPDYLPPHGSQSSAAVNVGASANADAGASGVSGGGGFSAGRNSGAFRGPDYLPPHGSQSSAAVDVSANAGGNSGAFRGPDYLPPHGSQSSAGVDVGANAGGNSGAFRGPEYLPPYQSQAGTGAANLSPASFGPSSFRGPDYLPPLQGTQNGGVQSAQQGSSGQGQFKGPDYLPPHQSSSQAAAAAATSGNAYEQGGQYAGQVATGAAANTAAYHAPEYLPPRGAQLSQPIVSPNSFKGPDYLPPQREVPQHVQLSPPQQTPFKGPEYLPPHGQNIAAGASAAAAAAQASQPNFNSFPASNALSQSQSTSTQAASYSATPGTLPDGYDFQRPDNAEEAIAELHSLQIAQQQQEQQQLQQGQQGQQQVVVQSQIQVSGREADADIVYGQPKPELSGSFQGNAYLPPANAGGANIQAQPQANYQIQQGNVQTVGSSYDRAAATGANVGAYAQHQQQQTYSAPEYLPPASGSSLASGVSGAAVASPHIHSLSSYMTAVQPFARYGNAQFTGPRKPFAEYGPPKAAALPVAQPQPQQFQVAPMYREQGTRFQYYAPAMSYSSSSVGQTYFKQQQQYQSQTHHSGFTLNQQARQSLQRFMPKEIQQASQYIAPPAAAPTVARAPAAPVAPQAPIIATAHVQAHARPSAPAPQPQPQPPAPAPVAIATLPAVAPIAAKIRTVQIISANTVKTLKVLESSDQAGVKTIKILGPSNETPRGDHRVVKVVTSHGNGHDNHIQTVKIFNDQQEVPLRGNNAYLPPALRSSRKRSVRKVRQTLQRHLGHGHSRRRLRY